MKEYWDALLRGMSSGEGKKTYIPEAIFVLFVTSLFLAYLKGN